MLSNHRVDEVDLLFRNHSAESRSCFVRHVRPYKGCCRLDALLQNRFLLWLRVSSSHISTWHPQTPPSKDRMGGMTMSTFERLLAMNILRSIAATIVVMSCFSYVTYKSVKFNNLTTYRQMLLAPKRMKYISCMNCIQSLQHFQLSPST